MSNSIGPDFSSNSALSGGAAGGLGGLGAMRRLTRSYSSGHLLVIGSIDVVAGLIALAWPGVTIVVLALIFGLLLLMVGVMAIGVGSVVRRAGGSPVATYVIGGIAVVAGLICIFHPGAGIWAIVLGSAIWFLLTGLGDLLVASASPANRVWFGILGVLSIVAAIVLLTHPGVAIVTVALIAGISFIVRGVGELALGWRIRKLAH
ncbi:uncharacterized membrane protein HdeD (DUF308 family) [Nakamurella sp. UYEF19]|uniref:HdeD family acid-resistance protein n=1 Tax=Nakamurella sp. UYEF19 TaxID=1756392 RepID=UPI003397F399